MARKMRKISMEEADNLDIDIVITEEMWEDLFQQIDADLRAHGWKGTSQKNISPQQPVLAAEEPVSKLTSYAHCWLRREFSGIVFSYKNVTAYVDSIGRVHEVEITFFIHGQGIKPRNRTLILSKKGFSILSGKVKGTKAMNLPLAFEITEKLMEDSRASLEARLREQGWKGNFEKGVTGKNIEVEYISNILIDNTNVNKRDVK